MRKRRRLANKMTMMVCAVLIAVSAFFYVPMEVEAEEVIFNSSVANINNLHFTNAVSGTRGIDFLDSEFNNDDYYYFKIRFDVEVITNSNILYIRNFSLRYADRYLLFIPSFADSYTMNFNETREVTFCSKGSWLKDGLFTYDFRVLNGNVSLDNVNFDVKVDYEILESIVLTGEQSSAYEQGYNAGYSAGEAAGESNGYSSGYSDGYEAGEQSGYDSGFQAGSDSVDTQSYYDAGYSAGYDAGYATGYDTGYDEGYDAGWSAYEAQMDKWGADTSNYPLLVLDSPLRNKYYSITVKSSIPTKYFSFDRWTFDYNFNPNHTYRFDVVLTPTEYKEGSADIYFLEYNVFYFNIGGIKYYLSNFSGADVNQFFVPGSRMSNSYSFSWEPLLAIMGDTFESGGAYCYYDLSYQIYDMGPSGDTQNHIANQTDQLTGGYNDSQGNSVNNDFSSGLNEFETAEDSLFATATTGLKDFTFFDFESVPAMVTGMSFVGSIMGSWFAQAGGASGVGIVLSILFSIMLVAMVLGLYRWYQSRGGKD